MDSGGSIINLEIFENENFNVDNYVKKIAAESIYASSIAETKDKLNRHAIQTAEEIKQSVYKNYGNFMETAKEVGHLEGKMSQLRQSLDDQRKLLNLFKNLNVNTIGSANLNSSTKDLAAQNKSSLSLLLEQVEGCGLIAQKPGRSLLYHSDLDALHLDDYSVSHKLHAYLLSDALLLTLPQRKRNKTNYNTSSTSGLASNSTDSSMNSSSTNTYQYKFQAFYELQDIKIMNIDDSKEVRNSFQLLKFPESLAFRCANAHIKKEWLENIENARKQLNVQINIENQTSKKNGTIEEEDESGEIANSTKIKNNRNEFTNDFERNKFIRDLFSDFDILLAQRDFEKAVEMLLKIKQSTFSKNQGNSEQQDTAVEQLIYKQKETELINILRRDLTQSKDRGNNKGVVKTGKRVVNSLIKLTIYDEAIDLFIDYHKHLNAETLRKIKLEESNTVYMNNVLNLFFENLTISYLSFKEAFQSLVNSCYSTYISWVDSEIEILLKKLQSQHYLGRHFDLTIENSELIFIKAKQFSDANNFEVKFLFETKMIPILETSIKEQYDILIEASKQRSKLELENSPANNEQNRQVHIQKFIKDIESKQLESYFSDEDIKLLKMCTSSCIQFSSGLLKFFTDCLRIYYQDISFSIVETITKLFKAELKIYLIYLKENSQQQANTNKIVKLNKQDIYSNTCFTQKIFICVEKLFFNKTGVHSKFFIKLAEKFNKFKEESFL